MKFQKLSAFEKHFKEAFPQHLSSIYIIVCSKESERKKILRSLAGLLEPGCDFKRCTQIMDATGHLNSGSLLSGKVAALFEEVDGLLKKELELLSQYIKSPNPNGCLLLGASGLKAVNDLYKTGKNEIVILDLTKEKPWDEKERIQKWVVQLLIAENKRISPEVVDALLKRLPSDRILLQQEIEKLLCYVGDRGQITLGDIKAICSESLEHNHFEMARSIIWNDYVQTGSISDLSFLLPLISQMRFQLEIGLKMTALLKRRASPDEISGAFPSLWPKALKQCLEGARKKKEPFFRKGLLALYDFELSLKTSCSSPDILFTQFCARLYP